MKLTICILAFNFVFTIGAWDCGSGFISEGLALLLASPSSDKEEINKCCTAHDRQYTEIEDCEKRGREPPFCRRESDAEFALCLENCPNRYTQTVVRYGYGALVYMNRVGTETWNKFKTALGF
ncbi:Phospholipase A(2) [Caenorhabditis elegans]|uniref:Phospholipase A(2) n=1 Tax=Caenorhabditis elegans TaxID=6239 RepID=Q565C0_CAEEL|nr:Phospholipase A(2) [Caenorhabditis elegans]CAI79182.1 Phospholipase A(2) [Caenorhabditis elegans]|eukprot:NP_001024938.1 Uncharacterized protein CELE_W04G3.10 [Caenorhabditis elegans]